MAAARGALLPGLGEEADESVFPHYEELPLTIATPAKRQKKRFTMPAWIVFGRF